MTGWLDDDGLELERYEQHEPLRHRFELDRRRFLQTLGGGLLVAVLAPVVEAAPQRGRRGARRSHEEGADPEDRVDAWLRIGPDESVTVYTGKVEVGQGIRTSLAQTVSEELRVPIERVGLVMGDTDLTPYDRGTHGSQSTPRMAPRLRAAAATARGVLIDLAAGKWGVPAASLRTAEGAVVDPAQDRRLTYGALMKGENLTAEVDDDASVQAAEDWQMQGQPVGKVDARAVVTGRLTFVSDVRLPDMQHGKVLRPPSWGAQLVSVDVSAAETMPEVTVVHDGDFVGVVAPDPRRAGQALAKITAEWKEADAGVSSADLFEHLETHPVERKGWGGRRAHAQGSLKKGLRAAKHRLSARYTVPYIAHAPLEPRAAVACWVGGKVLVWAGTQHPFPVRDDVARAFGIPTSQVRVRVPHTGSGYGGKHTAETAIEAARLARAAGVPVKLEWTRPEEFAWAYFRPAGVITLRSGTSAPGKVIAWEHFNHNSGGSAIEPPYGIPNQKIVFQPAESPARQGSYRGLAATANTFARESHLDEIAAKLGRDPLELRRANLEDERLRAVLDAAAKRFGWGSKPRAGRGVGLAVGHDKGGYVSTCVEVAVAGDDTLHLVRLVTAFECGAIVNPDNLENQVEGAVIMGLGGALWEAIEFDAGKIENGRFAKYRVPRLSDIPPMETVLLDRPDLASAGAGETPLIAVAPAIANAIFSATGRRIRDLPLTPGGRLRGV